MADGKIVAPEGAQNVEVNLDDTLQPWERGQDEGNLGDALVGGWESAQDDPDADGESLESEEDDEVLELEDDDDEEDLEDPNPDPEEPEEESDEEESESEEQEEPEDSAAEKLHKVVLPGGEETEVTLEELAKGYSRQSDYTRKTQEVAEIRKEVAEKREAYQKDLQGLKAIIESLKPEEPDWADLRAKDPAEYAALREDYKQFDQRIGAIQAEVQRVEQEAAEEHQKQIEKIAQTEHERLMQVFPEWRDPSVRESNRKELWDFAQATYGFAPEELSQVLDHRVIRLLNDAHTAKTVEEKAKGITRKKSSQARTGKQTLKPGAGQRKVPSKTSKIQKERNEAASRWQKTGQAQDALSLFETFVD